MDIYNYWCIDCKSDFSMERDDLIDCPFCNGEVKRLGRRTVALHGLKKGPGAAYNGPVFEKPQAEKDILYTAKKIEEGGKMTPQMEQAIKSKLDRVRANPPKPVDYGKDGHPLDNC